MPSTLVGLVIFVAGLAPGLAFVLARQRISPQRAVSAVRETAQLVFVSLALDLAVLVVFGVVRAVWPSVTPDVGRLVREPGAYWRESYLLVTWWSVGALVLAIAAGALVGARTVGRMLGRPDPRPHESRASAWWLVLQEAPRRRVHVACTLDDGSYVAGWLASYNTDVAETGDRDLVLAAPIQYRPAGAANSAELVRTTAAVVSARKIALLLVSYQAPDPAPRAAPSAEPPPV
ncbi:DUF6338 family protein [Actinokineospora fastidiosa]|nr:DUF6338 family protein [Actinokineospora fastidiosa]